MLWWLLKQLRSDDRDIFLRAAEKAARTREVKAVEPLLDALQHRNPWFREAAARALAAIGDPRAVPPLRILTEDSDSLVREATKMALAHLEGKPVPPAEPAADAADDAPFEFEDDTSVEGASAPLPAAVAEDTLEPLPAAPVAPSIQGEDAPSVEAGEPPAEPSSAPSDSASTPAPPALSAAAPEAAPEAPSPAAAAPPPAPKRRLASLQDALLSMKSEQTPIASRKAPSADDLLRSLTSKALLADAVSAKPARPKGATPLPLLSELDRIVQSQLVGPAPEEKERKPEEEADSRELRLVAALLADSSRPVRLSAVKTLADMSSPRAVPVLVDLVADSDSAVAAAVADALIGYGESASERLAPLLEQPDERTRVAAAAIMSRIDPDWTAPDRQTEVPAQPPADSPPAETPTLPTVEAPTEELATAPSDASAPDQAEAEGAQPAPPLDAPAAATPTDTAAAVDVVVETAAPAPEEPCAAEVTGDPLAPPDVAPLIAPNEHAAPLAAAMPALAAPKELILAVVSDKDELRIASGTVLDSVYPGWREAAIDAAVLDTLASALRSPNSLVADAARRCLASLTHPDVIDALSRSEGST